MAFLDGLTTAVYRYTPDGRRIYHPRWLSPRRYWRAYHITDDVRHRFEWRFKRAFVLTFAVIAIMPIIQPTLYGSDSFLRAVIAGALTITLLMEALMRWWVLRGIERVQVSPEELMPVNRQERDIAAARATGMTTLVVMVAGSFLMASAAAIGIAEDGGDKTASVLGTVLFSALALSFVRQIYILKRAGRRKD